MTTIPEDKLEGIISKGKELEKQLGKKIPLKNLLNYQKSIQKFSLFIMLQCNGRSLREK